jgi:uncharacterized protein Yka (UPF0111/DUF47 family)
VSIQQVIRWLLPREDHFFDFLERQAKTARLGAIALAKLNEGASGQEVAEAVQVHEHDGDKLVHEMEDALAKTFVTPIDREDLARLSQELDDILDMMNLSARYFVIYRVTGITAPMRALIDLLVDATAKIDDAMPRLRKHDYPALMELSRTLRVLEKEGDTAFRDAVRELFEDPDIDAKALLKQKEILEDLEHAIDKCERVANTLATLSVKHG